MAIGMVIQTIERCPASASQTTAAAAMTVASRPYPGIRWRR
jgi:hypothetical protein